MSKNTHLDSDAIINFGGEVKFLEERQIGGYLVLFTNAGEPDLAGDFFDKNTDFGTAAKSTVYFDHGLDPILQLVELGDVKMNIDEVGVWSEGYLQLRSEYEGRFSPYLAEIYKHVAMKKMGWSSGTAGHLVVREPVSPTVSYVKRWILGLDASLTHTPCEPKTRAVALKSYQSEPFFGDAFKNAHSQKNYRQLWRDYQHYRFEQISSRKS